MFWPFVGHRAKVIQISKEYIFSNKFSRTLVSQSSRMLTLSPRVVIIEALLGQERNVEEPEVRLPSATDDCAAAYFAFLAQCSARPALRRLMIAEVSRRENYIPTLLKFFGVVSPKTLPHVAFQKQVIVSFNTTFLIC